MLYTPHVHSLSSHVGVFLSFFLHAVWVSFTSGSIWLFHSQTHTYTQRKLDGCLREEGETRVKMLLGCLWLSMCLCLSVKLILTVARSWYNSWLILSMVELVLVSCCFSPVQLLPQYLSPSQTHPARKVEQGLQYKDINGCHVVIRSKCFNGISWGRTMVNQIHMESWLKAVFELLHRTYSKGELYLSDYKWLRFHCNFCVSFYPALTSSPIPHCIFKGAHIQ